MAFHASTTRAMSKSFYDILSSLLLKASWISCQVLFSNIQSAFVWRKPFWIAALDGGLDLVLLVCRQFIVISAQELVNVAILLSNLPH